MYLYRLILNCDLIVFLSFIISLWLFLTLTTEIYLPSIISSIKTITLID